MTDQVSSSEPGPKFPKRGSEGLRTAVSAGSNGPSSPSAWLWKDPRTAQPQAPTGFRDGHSDYIGLAADIVSAFVSNNSVPVTELPALIGSVHAALQTVSNPIQVKAPERPAPAVPVKKSVTPDAIISLIDGKPYKSMKRHLARHGLTPAQYRERYDLPRDYPVVAASYAAKRSELAKSLGLGQQRRKAAPKSADTAETISAPTKKKSSRKKAA